MYHFYVPTQNASIYSEFPGINTGLDEQLEIGKTNEGIDSVRALLQFDLTPIINCISSSIIPINATYEMRLYVSNASQLRKNAGLEIYQTSQSWEEGQGYFYQNIFNDATGVSWTSTTSGSLWILPGGTTGSVKLTTTASVPLGDFFIDVSSFVQSWLSGTFPNNGFLVRFPSASEQDTSNMGNIKIFSRNTHTIFQPQLIAKWDSQVYLTGSLTSSSPTQTIILAQNLKPEYRQNEFVHVDLVVRDRYPLKNFDTSFDEWSGNRYLPSASYYSVKDEQTGITIIPFDPSSKISTNQSGSYIEFKAQHMYPLRYYRLITKTIQNGNLEQIDDLGLFKITN